MRFTLFASLLALVPFGSARADLVSIAVNSGWTTIQDATSATKICGIQIQANGGSFTVFGTSDQPGVLRIGLRKSAWHITGVAVPIVVTFKSGAQFNFDGYGTGETIRADVPGPEVKPFIHHLTADDEASLVLPKGHEAPWKMDLHGTTPATLAMAPCIDATQMILPPPFRAPQPVVADTAPAPTPQTPAPSATSTADTSGQGNAEAPAPSTAAYPSAESSEAPPPVAPPPPVYESSTGLGTGISALMGVGSVALIALLVASIVFYFIPYIVGKSRKIENTGLLLITNFFCGWTILGWFGCLLWAALAQDGIQRAIYAKMLRDGQ